MFVMRKYLAGAALCALIALPTVGQATTHTLTLTGDISALTTNNFTAGATFYETGQLALSGFRPFVMQDGDDVAVTVTITGGAFTLPIRQNMFFGLNFSDILGGLQPTTASANGQFSFNSGPLVGAGCGNCTSLISYQSSAPLSFSSLAATGVFNVNSDYDINSISVSYQADGPAVAVPEPATWALMISGFGMAGAMFRRRRGLGLHRTA